MWRASIIIKFRELFLMSTHNYTAETYNGNLQILNNSISRINQTILPSDPISQFSMGYSVEIASFNSVLSDLQEICAKTISVYEKAKSEVCGNDTDSAAKLEDPIHDFSSLMTTLNSMASVMISGGNTSTFGKELEESLSDCTYEGMAEVKLSEYVTYDDTTGEYTYDWTQLSLDLQSGMDCSSELIFLIYDAFMDDCDNIDLDELENFLKVLATNGHNLATEIPPDDSEENMLASLTAALEYLNACYLKKLNSSDLDEKTKKEITKKLSLNNIVIVASKTIRVNQQSKEFCSSAPAEEKKDDSELFKTKDYYDKDGNKMFVTVLQPVMTWRKTDKTLQELKDSGIQYEIRDDGVYVFGWINSKTIYWTDVDLNISEYSSNTDYGPVTGYKINSGDSRSVTYDYSNDRRAVYEDLDDQVGSYYKDKNVKNMEGLKEDNEWEEDIKGGVKKEALSKAKKWIEKIPYVGDVVEGVDEVVELVGDVYDVYSDHEETDEENEKIEHVISKYKSNDSNEEDRKEWARNNIKPNYNGNRESNECNETVTVVFDDDVEITVERNGKSVTTKN